MEKKIKLFTPILIIFIGIFILSGGVYTVCIFSSAFAEWWARYPSHYFRACLAYLTNLIPFSVAEMMLLLILPLLAVYVLVAFKYIRENNLKKYYACLRPLLIIILILVSSFLGVFGPCYYRNALDVNMGFERNNVTAEELKDTALYVIEELDDIDVKIRNDGSTVYQCDYPTLVDDIKKSFHDFCADKSYIRWYNSNPKLVSLSPLMTYTHISGVYSFFTGEANINYNYPPFVLPYTIAHEMSHQRGIAREDEANFVAFLVCINSDNDYVRYSGLFNMLEYLLSALKKADAAEYKSFVNNRLSDRTKNELRAYSVFFEKYTESAAATVAGTVNNAYLESQGQSAGSASYGLVVDLAVAYYKQKT